MWNGFFFLFLWARAIKFYCIFAFRQPDFCCSYSLCEGFSENDSWRGKKAGRAFGPEKKTIWWYIRGWKSRHPSLFFLVGREGGWTRANNNTQTHPTRVLRRGNCWKWEGKIRRRSATPRHETDAGDMILNSNSFIWARDRGTQSFDGWCLWGKTERGKLFPAFPEKRVLDGFVLVWCVCVMVFFICLENKYSLHP